MGIIKTAGRIATAVAAARSAAKAATALGLVGSLALKAGPKGASLLGGQEAEPPALPQRSGGIVPRAVRPAVGALAVATAGALVARKVIIVRRRRRAAAAEAAEEGVVVPFEDAPNYMQDSVVVPAMSPYEELVQLKALLDMDAITQEDYDLKKAQLLGV